MISKKKPEKTPDKPKKREKPGRSKPKKDHDRDKQRRRAVNRAAALLKRFAIPFDQGDSLLICTRHKVMFAFDHPQENAEALQRSAATSGMFFIHLDASTFKHTELFDKMIVDAIDRKPVYAGKKSGVVPPVKVPAIEVAKRIKKVVKKLSAKQNNKTRTKKVEKISRRHLTR